jgi:enamine deaminase RidA (YjgF/YER057c/UK114 family)
MSAMGRKLGAATGGKQTFPNSLGFTALGSGIAPIPDACLTFHGGWLLMEAMMRKICLVGAVAGLTLTTIAHAQLTRVGNPSAAVADAVEAKGAVDTLYISGITPPALDPGAPAVRGDTKTQTLGILKLLGGILNGQGYGYGDVVMLHVYLVADPSKGGKMDFVGMKEAYSQVFGTRTQPGRPARATIQVAGLVDEGQLVEIAAVAVRRHKAR